MYLSSSPGFGAPTEPDPSPMQVYHLLFGPFPALDGKLGLLRKQEPWSRLGSNPLLQMEVRGLAREMGGGRGSPLVTHAFWGSVVCTGKWRQDGDLSAPEAPWNPGAGPHSAWAGRSLVLR